MGMPVPAGILPVGPLAPYVTPGILTQAPTGIAWDTIPPYKGTTEAQRLAAQANICQTATQLADGICKQPLRATTDDLVLYGPGTRVGARGGGPAELILTRWPVLEIVSVQVARNCPPYVWRTVPPELCWIKNPVSGLYGSVAPTAAAEGGQAILVSSQYVNLAYGPNGLAIQVTYINGWPHSGLTADAESGATQIQVDDCTGWAITAAVGGATGATGTVYDAGNQEVVQCTAATAAAGPGTLTLGAPLQSQHAAGTMVSTLPQSVVWAATLLSAAQALTRGATSTTVLQAPGSKSSGGGDRAMSLTRQAKAILQPFTRII